MNAKQKRRKYAIDRLQSLIAQLDSLIKEMQEYRRTEETTFDSATDDAPILQHG